MFSDSPLHVVFSHTDTPSLRVFSDPLGVFWFIARDVFRLLGVTATTKALSRLDSPDKRPIGPGNAYGLHRHAIAVSEQGVIELALTSRKPAAKALKARMFDHISPTLRALSPRLSKGIN